MASTWFVRCVKRKTNGAIEMVGISLGVGRADEVFCLLKQSVAEFIEKGDTVCVPSGSLLLPNPEVHVVRRKSGIYLRTDADAIEADNLGELPECTDC